MSGLVLSLFPGVGLLDMAFEEEGFCVVRGPDLLWGGDIRRFHPPAGKFKGVIGGPPCQLFGGLRNFAWRWKVKPENLIPEYERVVSEAHPHWFVMENVPAAPVPAVSGYEVSSQVLNNRWLGEEQDRARRFSWGVNTDFLGHSYRTAPPGPMIDLGLTNPERARLSIEVAALESIDYESTVTSAHGGGRPRMRGSIKSYSVARVLELQGLPADFFGHNSPLTEQGKRKVLAQGVPLPMGRAVAKAVKRALSASASPSPCGEVRE